MKDFAPALNYQIGFLMAEGDIVFVHGRGTGVYPEPQLGMEVWRIENGQIKEFWGNVQSEAAPPKALNTNSLFPIRNKLRVTAQLATAGRV